MNLLHRLKILSFGALFFAFIGLNFANAQDSGNAGSGAASDGEFLLQVNLQAHSLPEGVHQLVSLLVVIMC